MDIKEKNELKNEIALFRYGLIAPVVTDTYEESSMESYFRNVSSKNYIVNGKEEKFAPTTIKKWYFNYKKGGFNALIPKTRCDAIAYIKNHEYEVNMKYIGRKITVKYDPLNYDYAYIYDDNKLIEKINLVNKVDNSKIKRKSNLY